MTEELQKLVNAVDTWRKTRRSQVAKMPQNIEILVADAYKKSSTVEIYGATGIHYSKLREIRHKYAVASEGPSIGKVPRSPSSSQQVVRLSEVKVHGPLHQDRAERMESKLIACIDNDRGFRLSLFNNAANPGELISSFLAMGREVGR